MAQQSQGNILLAGVGGQGILLASEVLSSALLYAGFDVKKSEIHGMAQRGGSVVSHVRFGPRVYSPMIPEGQADYLVGFELLEAVRYLDWLLADGRIVANTLQLPPMAVAIGEANYPRELPEQLRRRCPDSCIVDALDVAQQAGSARAVNIVLLGALSPHLPVPAAVWQQALEAHVPAKHLTVNQQAFAAAQELA